MFLFTKQSCNNRRGFTLVEIMAAAILGLIAIAGLSVMMKAGMESNRVQQVKSQYITLIKAAETWMQSSTAIGWKEISIGELVEDGILPPTYCDEPPQENDQGMLTCGGKAIDKEIESTGTFPPYGQRLGIRGVEDEETGNVQLKVIMTDGIPADTQRAYEKFFKGKYGAEVEYSPEKQQLEVVL